MTRAIDPSGGIGRKGPVAMAGLFALCAALIAASAAIVTTARPGAAQQMSPAAQSSSSAVPIPELPRVVLQALPGYGVAPLMVGFLVQNGNPQSGEFVSYRWNFGDGGVSNMPPQAIFHTYTQPGSYVVTLTATTADGYNASGFAAVIVRPSGLQ